MYIPKALYIYVIYAVVYYFRTCVSLLVDIKLRCVTYIIPPVKIPNYILPIKLFILISLFLQHLKGLNVRISSSIYIGILEL